MKIRVMNIEDYDSVMSLWTKTPGIGISRADTKEGLNRFLKRNENLSFVCEMDNKIVGTILCGHDGRRGFIYHLAVDEQYRLKGIGKALVVKAIEELKREGIHKYHIFVIKSNYDGKKFWNKMGFKKREDIEVFSMDIDVKH